MRLDEVIKIGEAINELLELEVDPLLVYELNTVITKLEPHLNAYRESAKLVADESGRVTDIDKYNELLNKEVDIQLDKVINISSLPKSLKGSIVYALMPIIYKED